jgi:hypothetical protein
MLVFTSFVGIPMCHIFSCNILVTRDLGRILYVMLSLPSPGLTVGIG